MKLADAARYFDRTAVSDAYTGDALFQGQLDVFDDSKRDGVTVERRILSVAADVALPARGAVSTPDGRNWLIGTDFPDYFNGDVIRRKATLQRADDLGTIVSLSGACTGAAGTAAYVSRSWIKDSKEIAESARVYPVYDLYVAMGEPLAPFSLVRARSRWHLVRSVYESQAGYLVGNADELPEPVVCSATLATRTLDPVTETATGADTALTMVLLRWQSGFEYIVESALKYVAGDELGVVAATVASPRAGDLVTIGGVARRVLEVSALDDCYRLHLRRA